MGYVPPPRRLRYQTNLFVLVLVLIKDPLTIKRMRPVKSYLAQRKVAARRFVQLPVVRLALTGATSPTGLVYLAFVFTPVPCQAAAVCTKTQDTRAAPHHTAV